VEELHVDFPGSKFLGRFGKASSAVIDFEWKYTVSKIRNSKLSPELQHREFLTLKSQFMSRLKIR